MNEADTCRTYILPKLHAAGWEDDYIAEQLVLTPGRIVPVGQRGHRRNTGLRPDYVLFIRRNIPIAVLEAKAEYKHPAAGLQQAMRYADMLDVRFAYASNGRGIVEHDFTTGEERDLTSFPSPDELWARLRGVKGLNDPADAEDALSAYFEEVGGKTPRYYQQVAINRAVEAVIKGQPRILLTMATGTGKTFVAMQIAWRLWHRRRKTRILYLADRNILADQAKTRTFDPAFGQAIHKIRGQAVKSREMYFALYQALSSAGEGPNLYGQYPPDFFDLIFVDECHRGSAREESSWREILEYFEPAQQIGMTATPKRDDNVDTYDYFGPPIYTYSLRQGIADGFLAPYRVMRVAMDVDAYGLHIDPGVLDRFGREVPPGLYGTKEFERVISLLTRTEAVAHHLTQYLRHSDPYAKTIVFCVDQEHALDMRNALARANPDLVRQHPNYVARVVSDEGQTGRAYLDDFQDPEKETPVILTTSQMLTTGVDAPTCRNVVIFKPINSIVDFKQIIGRGTRVSEEHAKYWFTILDYTGATRLFYDPAFDGEPVQMTQVRIDAHGELIETGASEPYPTAGEQLADLHVAEQRRKYYLDGVTVQVANEQVYELDPAGNVLRTVALTDYVRDHVRRLLPDADHLRRAWPRAERRREILNALGERGIDLAHLAAITHREDADALDLLLHVAYNAPLLTRRERAAQLRQRADNFFNKYTPAAREILDALLEKYADYGIGQLDSLTDVLRVSPFDAHGTPLEIAALFGGPREMKEAVDELQRLLYE